MIKEFKEFIMRGNVMDMAVGIIIGAAFGGIVGSFVNDVIMPPIGLLLGHVDFSNMFAVLKQGATTPGPYASVAAAKAAGATTLNFGLFVNTLISFVILAFVIFLMVKGVNQLRRPKSVPAGEPTIKDCPFCYSSIPIKATRCPNCTSELKA
jgi:large conductance mechanosensitive channel